MRVAASAMAVGLAACVAQGATIGDEEITSSTTYSENVTVNGTLTVRGSGTELSLASGVAVTVTPGAGKVVVRDGATMKAPNQKSDNSFVVAKEAEGAAIESGTVDVLELDNGSVNLDFLNNATATGRISVVSGSAEFDRYNGWKSSNGTFAGNPWRVDVADGATAFFWHGNQGGHFNESGVSVSVTGAGTARLGQVYRLLAGGAFAVNAGARFLNTGRLELYGRNLQSGEPVGGAFVFNSGSVVDGPERVSIAADSGAVPLVLQVNAGADFTVRGLDLVRAGVDDALCGDGVITLDARAADVSVAANVPAALWDDATKANALAFEKVGANNATLAVTNIPRLVVSEGTATLTRDCAIGTLEIADGAALVVDGATLTYCGGEIAGAITLANGAQAIRVVTGAEGEERGMDRSGLRSDDVLLKTGDEDLIVYDPASVAGFVHVAGGALRFSKRGVSDKYLRLTVKECFPYGGDATSAAAYPGLYLKVGLFDTADAVVNLGYGSDAAPGTPASELAKGNQWAVPVGTLYTTDRGGCLSGAFGGSKVFPDNGWGEPAFTNATRTLCRDASDASGWLSIWGRLPDGAAALDGINFLTRPNNGWPAPKVWTVETSATGEDGTWRVVQDMTEPRSALNANNSGILYGDGSSPAAHFRYMEPGVTGLADVLQIRVEAGATLDFGAKEGGQVVDRIVVDATAGTVRNAVFAERGTIELVGSNDRRFAGLLPLVFENAGGTANLAKWQVVCGGKPCNRHVSFSAAEGKVNLSAPGCVFILR